MPAPGSHKWAFKSRFRSGAYGPGGSAKAVERVRQAVSEVKAVAGRDPVLAAEGAVTFLERVSGALEHVDSSSGAIGNAVNKAIEELVPIISAAPADLPTRRAWLERLYAAHEMDGIPYIELLGECWGDLCASPELASEWADQTTGVTRMVLRPDRQPGEFYHGTIICLSSLYSAGRFQEVVDLLSRGTFWTYCRWAARALVALGRKAEAIRYAETFRGPYVSDTQIDKFCESVLLSSGLVDEAYRRYGLTATRRQTYLATFRAVAKKYPHKDPAEVLADLAATTPGSEGKWFAAAVSVGLYDQALDLARRSPPDPMVLSRAADKHKETRPSFAMEAGLLAVKWMAAGYGWELTVMDVVTACRRAIVAAANVGAEEQARRQILEYLADARGLRLR